MDWTNFETELTKRMEKEHIPGVAVAVSMNDNVIYQKGFGLGNLEDQLPITPDTMFGTASVTKSFTALAIMQLVEQEMIALSDPVSTYLPAFEIKGMEPAEQITIHHLLTHTTGLAPIKRHEEFNYFADHLKYLKEEDHDLLGMPGEFFSYSNDAFLLLGAIIEKVTGRLYRRYITEEILYPLHMHRSTFSIEEVKKFSNVTVPYIFNKEKNEHESQPWPKLGNYEVGGGIRSTVLDLLKYGSLFLNDGKFGGTSIISEIDLKKIYQPYVQTDQTSYYGYAFKVTSGYYGTTLVEHSGGQPGVASNFGFLPEKNIAVAVLTNLSGATAGDIWLEAVNTVLELPLSTKRSVLPVTTLTEENKKAFVGEFTSEEGQQVVITLNNNELTAEIENEEFALVASDEQTLMIKENEKLIQFYFDDNGEPWAIFIGMRMLLRKKK